MRVELCATPNWLKITWPLYNAQVEAEILRRLATVPGAMGNGRRWFAPVAQIWALTELFPLASYDYTAMSICDELGATALAESDASGYMAEPIYRKPKKGQEKPKVTQGELWR